MGTKFCSRCKKNRLLKFFHKRSKSGVQSICKDCRKIDDKSRYLLTDKDEKNKQRRLKRAKFIKEYKAKEGCKYCPEDEPVCLDFHHVNDKIEQISKVKWWSFDRLLVEIEKCEVVCSNCHRKLHHGKLSPVGVMD